MRCRLDFLIISKHSQSAVLTFFLLVFKMTDVTISFHVDTILSQRHNRREQSLCSKEPHIDLNKTHENWVDTDIRDAYHMLFDDALNEYNAKQKRKDRKIADYYEHIKNSKQINTVYESIIGFYGKDEQGNEDPKAIDQRLCKAMLRQYFEKFKKENPNLYVIGAYYHADEQGAYPHLHIDFIPFFDGNKKGLSKQVGLNSALEQQYRAKGIKKTRKFNDNSVIDWTENQRKKLEEIANNHDFKVLKDVSKGRQHLDIPIFKHLAEQEKELNRKHTAEIKSANKNLNRRLSEKEKQANEDINARLTQTSKNAEKKAKEIIKQAESQAKKTIQDAEIQAKKTIKDAEKKMADALAIQKDTELYFSNYETLEYDMSKGLLGIAYHPPIKQSEYNNLIRDHNLLVNYQDQVKKLKEQQEEFKKTENGQWKEKYEKEHQENERIQKELNRANKDVSYYQRLNSRLENENQELKEEIQDYRSTIKAIYEFVLIRVPKLAEEILNYFSRYLRTNAREQEQSKGRSR